MSLIPAETSRSPTRPAQIPGKAFTAFSCRDRGGGFVPHRNFVSTSARFVTNVFANVRRSATHSHDGAVSPHQRRTAEGRAAVVPPRRFLRDVFRGRAGRRATAQPLAHRAQRR